MLMMRKLAESIIWKLNLIKSYMKKFKILFQDHTIVLYTYLTKFKTRLITFTKVSGKMTSKRVILRIISER